MADQSVSNERRKELEQMDPFQKNFLKTLAFAKTYQKQLMVILGAVVVVVVVFVGIMTSFQRAEAKASDLVAQALDQYNRLSADPKAAYDAVRPTMDTVLNEYANTDAGRLAHIRFAGICMASKDYDRALSLYQNALKLFGGQADMKNFLLSSLGHVYLAKGDLAQAQSCFQQIEAGASDLLKDESQFVLAGIYEEKQGASAGREMYEKLARTHENSLYKKPAQALSGEKSGQ